jgi:PH (Pleckstrin Homology) domain-containing protein
MPTTKPKVLDQQAPQIFRRVTTVTWAIVMVTFFVVVAVLAGIGLHSNGFLATIAPICVVSPLIVFALFSFYLPRVMVRDDAVTVRNALSVYRIPYAAISGFAESRIVLFILLTAGGKVPITAYASGSGARVFGHSKALKALTDAIEAKMYAAPKATGDEQVVRTMMTTKIVISVVSVVLAVGILSAAIATA